MMQSLNLRFCEPRQRLSPSLKFRREPAVIVCVLSIQLPIKPGQCLAILSQPSPRNLASTRKQKQVGDNIQLQSLWRAAAETKFILFLGQNPILET